MLLTPSPIPAKAALAMARISNRTLAAEYGCSPHYVGRVLNGYIPPSRGFAAFLVGRLGLSPFELFGDDTASALEARS